LAVFLGSGVTAENVAELSAQADGFIVGSEFKVGGHWAGAVDGRRVRRFLRAAREAR
jgi:predicted TIM-barrel enzyme